MPDIVLSKPKQKYWISYILQRIKRNKNFLGIITGPTGSGKSYSSLRIAQELDPEFNEERIVFTGVELMHLINSNKLKSGSVIIFEEVGVEMSNRNWHSTINKMINYLLQTFRHRNFILIFNAPYLDFIDSNCRKLFHAELRTLSIDKKDNVCKVKPQLIQYNSRLQKFYYKYLRVITPQGVAPVKVWRVDKPSKDLLKEYEAKKRKFTDGLNKDILDELLNAHKKKAKQQCANCGYRWYPRGNAIPRRCPKCDKIHDA